MQSLLLKWFKQNKRPLPWRKTKDPYKIWVSEIMLQQTQVNTVIPYYERWIKTFPNVNKLSSAPLTQVLKSWEGLGYYRRAKNLHRAAKTIVKRLKGKFPDSLKEWLRLPGVGSYTAGAIASIAFEKSEPILDGNVARVLSRIFAIKEPIDKTDGKKKLWGIARTLVKESVSKGDFNQSLMELGALICLPENPKCLSCPVNRVCKAHRLKRETEFPIKMRKVKMEKLKTVAALIWKNGKVLIEKQPAEARWGGLWTFPQWIHSNGQPERNFLKNRVRKKLGIKIDEWRPRAEFRHGFTKYHVRLRVYEGRTSVGQKGRTWVKPENLSRFPLPSPHQKIAKLIQNHGK
ncbi:MAG: A/G-specific adenine glycosylase [Candidatus Omnitrophica bacterium]|nr:A/G-specific adenine glycosylase [Candidatus Omnitrophota bacterium]